MEKLDFKKSDKQFYSGKAGRFDVLDVPPMQYLMIDGDGGPVGSSYPLAIAALYGLSYGLKFFAKQELGREHVVGPLQALWWADDMNTFITREKSAWKWTAMIRQPDWISQQNFKHVLETVVQKNAKKKQAPTTEEFLRTMRLQNFEEGRCVQILHMGSYDDEGPTLHKMHHEFIPQNGFEMVGKHHEIYLSDPRKVAPEKLKTILRQPVKKAQSS